MVDSKLSFELIQSSEAMQTLRPFWNRLLSESASDRIFLSWEWLSCWWESYGALSSREMKIILVKRGNDPVAILPLMRQGERKGPISFVTLRFLGDGSYDSDYLDFIVKKGEERAILTAFWKYLYEDKSGALRFDLLRLCEFPADSPNYPVVTALLAERHQPILEQRVGCVFTRLPDQWEAYVATLKPRMRTKVRSLSRRLEESHKVRLILCRSEEDIDPALASLYDLHGRRWEGAGQSGVFTQPEKRSFYRLLSGELLRKGWLRFYSLEVDGVRVAHQFCFAYEGTVSLLQEGYDPDWEEQGIGNVLRARVFQESIAEGMKVYDFLGGVTPHKLSWGGEIKESVRMTCGGRGIKSRLYFGISALKKRIKAMRNPPEKGASQRHPPEPLHETGGG